jgi:hypothetical protein
MQDRLPEQFASGTVLMFPGGVRATVVVCARTNEYGERLYRLRYHARKDGKWRYPEVISRRLWEIEELAEAGAQIEKD